MTDDEEEIEEVKPEGEDEEGKVEEVRVLQLHGRQQQRQPRAS